MTDQRELIVFLEKPLTDFFGDPIRVREILIAGLTWNMPYWPELAVRWIEEGASIDLEICELLDQIVHTKHFPQGLRHRARAASSSFTRGGAKA